MFTQNTHPQSSPLFRLFRPLIVLSAVLLFSLGVHAKEASSAETPSASKALSISIGKSNVQNVEEGITRVSVGDPSIADVVILSHKQFYLVGKKVGSTNILIWANNHQLTSLEVSVSADPQSVLRILSEIFPEEKNIRISSAGESLVLLGQVSDATKVQQAVMVAQEFTGKKVLNMMTLDQLPQVLLEVKIAEVDKTVADALGVQLQGSSFSFNMLNGTTAPLGFSANASGTSGSVSTWLQAQINSGVVKILAEPNIMATSGQDGEFLSGGIVFLPIPQSNGFGATTITLQPQNYGIGVKFTPTVLAEGRINLKVSPQVSEVQTQGITVTAGSSTTVLPSITTRQASTTVQLYDGESFVIGGLIKNNVTEIVSAFPALANIPILGALFRSSTFKADRSELMIVVTPHIVKPLAKKPGLPTDNFTPPTASEFFLDGKLEGENKATEEGSK